jgi:hypothetical protein
MNCPKCKTEIPDAEIARHLASKGGKKTGPTKARSSGKMREAQRLSVIARKLNAQKPRGKGRKEI